MKFFGLLIALLLCHSSYLFALNLRQASLKALDESLKVKTALAEKDQAEKEITKSKSPFLPQLDLKASIQKSYFSQNSSIPDWNRTAGLALTQNLWNNNLDSLRLDLDKKKLASAEVNLKKIKSEVILETIKLYIDALEKKNFNDLEKQFLLESNKIFKIISSQYYQGTRSRQDFLRFQSQNERAKLSSLNAEYKAAESLKNLKHYLNSAEIDHLEEIILEKQPLLQSAFDGNDPYYEIQSLQIQQQILEIKNEISNKDNSPSLEFKAETGYSLEGTQFQGQSWLDQDQTYWTVGLNLKWNLLDWGYRSAVVSQNYSVNAISELNSKQEVLNIQNTLNIEKENLQSLKKQFELADRLYQIEKENQIFSSRDFQDGKGTYTSYSSSIADYSSSVTQRNLIKFNLISSKFKISHLLGLLNENSIQ